MIEVLVLYYSQSGNLRNMAEHVARGIDSVNDCTATLRTVPAISAVSEKTADSIPSQGHLYATCDDLRRCNALVLGSPTRFGNMAAPLKYLGLTPNNSPLTTF